MLKRENTIFKVSRIIGPFLLIEKIFLKRKKSTHIILKRPESNPKTGIKYYVFQLI